MLLDTLTRACRARVWSGCTTAALLLISILAAPAAWAHNDPPTAAGGQSTATGIGVTMTAFRSDMSTAVLPGTITQCETIYYQATLNWQGEPVSGFEGGTWTLETPDGVVHDVTPAGGLPCISGPLAEDDPDTVANGGRGLCAGAPDFIDSALVPYTVRIQDIDGFQNVVARTDLTNAYAHIDGDDQAGVTNGTPFPLEVVLCDDGVACNGLEICNETTFVCDPGTPVNCDSFDTFCLDVECEEPTGECTDETPINGGQECNPEDATLCTPDLCTDAGECGVDNGTPVNCDPLDEFCLDVECTESSGECTTETPINGGQECNPEDATLCTPDLCTDAGECGVDNGTPVNCDPLDEFCLDVECTESSGECTTETPINGGQECNPEDATLCTPDLCTDAGECGVDNGTPVNCDPLDEFCLDVECTESSGECTTETPINGGQECNPEDATLCTPDLCTDAGECGVDNGTPVVCDDEICEECIESTGVCVDLPPDVAPAVCFPSFICRTGGFYGTHAADPKKDGFNGNSIVEDILEWGGPLMVCGQMLDTSYVDAQGSTPSNSTTEAICVSPKGASELQLARQLTVLALNCRVSGGELLPEDDENLCTGTFVDELFGACDAACQDEASPYTVSECIEMVDCINNGGDIDTETGMCLGTVSEDNCHTRDLCPDGAEFCYQPPGLASSPRDCNAAVKNDIYIIDADVNSGGRD